MPEPDPIPIIIDDEVGPNLAQALNVEDPKLLKYYGYWDLARFAKFSKGRMQQLFLVSKPGGHPRPWNAVSGQCIVLLENLLKTVNDTNTVLANRWESRGYRTTTFDKSLLQPARFNQMSYSKSVNDATRYGTRGTNSLDWFWGFFDKSNDGNDVGTLLFHDWQLHSWNIEALGNIICASYSDDKYGVVQKDLGKIIGCLADLWMALERNGRLTATTYSSENRRRTMTVRRVAIKERLGLALKQINQTFSAHLK